MNMEVYKKLALKLDDLPNRYPATESGIELRLLEKYFLLSEAILASEMYFEKESAKIIASRAILSEKEALRILKGMVRQMMLKKEDTIRAALQHALEEEAED